MKQNYRILVVTRANAIHDGQTIRFQNLDGVYLDSIAAECQKMTLLTPIYYKEKDEMYEIFKNYTYQFISPNLTCVNIPDYKNQNYNLLNAITRLPQQFLLSLREIFHHNVILVMMPTHRAVFTAIAGRFLRKKVLVYSGNDWSLDLETTFKWKGWIKNYLFSPYQKACELLEKLAMLSAHTRLLNGASLLQKYQNYPGSTIQTLPLINLKKNDLYKRKNTCQNPTIQLLCVASIQKRKGIDYLIQAFAQLLTQYPNLQLKLVGGLTQPYGEEMTTLCHHFKIQNQVTFTGYITNGIELLKLYRESDIFILPSLSEGFPRVLFEAMSQSLPIITTNIFNIFNRLNDSGIVYYVQPANVESLSTGIETLILNPDLRQSLIEKGFQYLQQLLNQNPSQQVLDSLKTFKH